MIEASQRIQFNRKWIVLSAGRYYGPTLKRFINADTYTDTNTGFLGQNMYAYCNNNPVVAEDQDGQWLQVVIGAAIGGVAGLLGQVISDVITSFANNSVTVSNWQTYVAACAGGATGGIVLASTGNVSAANAITGAVTTGVGQALEKLTIKSYDKSWKEIALNTVADGAISYGLGKLPGVRGKTSGRNSWNAVYRSGLTKLRNHTARRMSGRVIRKGIGASVVSGVALDGYYGVKQFGYNRIKNLFLNGGICLIIIQSVCFKKVKSHSRKMSLLTLMMLRPCGIVAMELVS